MATKTQTGGGFQWNAGGWFGSQIGATVWIAICAILLVGKDLSIAAIIFIVFLIPNSVGTALWIGRSRISAYAGIQILLAVCWICSLATVYAIEGSGLWAAVSGIDIDGQGTGTVAPISMKLLIALMFPAMMLFFFILNRQFQK